MAILLSAFSFSLLSVFLNSISCVYFRSTIFLRLGAFSFFFRSSSSHPTFCHMLCRTTFASLHFWGSHVFDCEALSYIFTQNTHQVTFLPSKKKKKKRKRIRKKNKEKKNICVPFCCFLFVPLNVTHEINNQEWIRAHKKKRNKMKKKKNNNLI